MTSKHAEILLEKIIQEDVKDYIIDEDYYNFYTDILTLSDEEEERMRYMFGARVHDVFITESNDHYPKINMRAHITFENITYTLLAVFDDDVDVIVLYETEEIIKSICNIQLPKEELRMLKSLSY